MRTALVIYYPRQYPAAGDDAHRVRSAIVWRSLSISSRTRRTEVVTPQGGPELLAVRLAVVALLLIIAGCGDQEAGDSVDSPSPPAIGELLRGAFSPDGSKIAYVGLPEAGSRVGVVETEGPPTWITPANRDTTDFAWLPESDRLLVADRPHVKDPLSPNAPTEDRISVIEVSGDRVRTIETSRPVQINGAGMDVSPDGRYAVVAASAPAIVPGPTDLFRIDLSSGETTRLMKTEGTDEGNPSFATASSIVCTTVTDDQPRRSSIVSIDLETKSVQPVSPATQYAQAATVGYDGATIVYAAYEERSDRRGLWRKSGAEEPELALAGPFGYPSLAPDGRSVIVSVAGKPGTTEQGFLEVHELDAEARSSGS